MADSGSFDAFARTVASDLERTFGRTQFDYLLNDAGISLNASIADTTEAQLDEVYKVHFKAPLFAHATTPTADRRRWAHPQPDRLLILRSSTGGEREIDCIAAFDRVAAQGRPELILGPGYSGIGKSSVVNELHKQGEAPSRLGTKPGELSAGFRWSIPAREYEGLDVGSSYPDGVEHA